MKTFFFCAATALPVALSTCNDAGTPPPAPGAPSLEICDGEALDAIEISSVSLDPSTSELTLVTEYSGGCADHDFTLCWDESWIKTLPPKAQLKLVHNANGDNCRAWITEPVTFDISLLGDSSWDAGYDELYVLAGDAQILWEL